MKIWITHEAGVALLEPIPDGVEVEVFSGEGEPPSDPATVDFWVPPYMSGGDAVTLLDAMTNVKVVQLLTAGAEVWEPRVPASVTLCDGKGIHTASTADWTMTAILASLRRFDVFARQQARREWAKLTSRTLTGRRVMILGAGDIGEAVAARLAGFDTDIVRVARSARPGVHTTDELPELLPTVDIVVVIVPLTDATKGLVDAEFLGHMRDGALLVNAARGPVVDTDALVAETSTGRLWAALDVTDPEPLPSDHELWELENVLITPHVGGLVPGIEERGYTLVAEQLRRFAEGKPLDNVVSEGY